MVLLEICSLLRLHRMSVSDKFSQLVNVVIIVIVCIHVPLTTLFEIDTVKKIYFIQFC